MKKSTIVVLSIVGVLVLLIVSVLGWGIGTYNSLVSEQENVQKYASDIQADLQRRSDLIPNLVETVKGYASQEEEIFTEIADARSKLAGATNLQESAQADSELSSALSRLLMVVENYPELKSNENFIALQDQLEGTENRIKVARTKYNEAAQEYNTSLKRFPTSIIGSMFGFEQTEYFEASEGAEQVPSVDFGA